MQQLMSTAKRVLSQIIPDSRRLQFLAWLPRLETWRRKHPEQYQIFENRYLLYEWLNAAALGNCAIDYLEFGAYKGDSIRRWSELNGARNSRFWGFDTFTGLPETWDSFTETMKCGHFDAGGAVPNIDDRRVSFVKGLFQHTLRSFSHGFNPASQLVIHIDADIYSAALYVLTYMNDSIKPGTIIIFDEFSSALHEFRALEDYCAAYLRTYQVLAAVRSGVDYYSQIAIQMTT
jgi:O-methyltransferase